MYNKVQSSQEQHNDDGGEVDHMGHFFFFFSDNLDPPWTKITNTQYLTTNENLALEIYVLMNCEGPVA